MTVSFSFMVGQMVNHLILEEEKEGGNGRKIAKLHSPLVPKHLVVLRDSLLPLTLNNVVLKLSHPAIYLFH